MRNGYSESTRLREPTGFQTALPSKPKEKKEKIDRIL